MDPEITVILDSNDKLTDFNQAHTFILFRNEREQWITKGSFQSSHPDFNSLQSTRIYVQELMKALDTSKILLGKTITGLPYQILNAAGYILCEADDYREDVLNSIFEDYCKQNKQPELIQEEIPLTPVETGEPGLYFLDMIHLQTVHPDISSKKALFPFFKEVPFLELKIKCSHNMPWFDYELPARNLIYTEQRFSEEGYSVITIVHKQCSV